MSFDVDKKIFIAMAKGNAMNIRVTKAEMSFRSFSEFCSKPQKGGKHESYFLRGVPKVQAEYKSGSGKIYKDGMFRCNDSIESAEFLVVDADDSISTPLEAHTKFSEAGLIHFIYTTHSHSKEKNNFRVVIPCEMDSIEYCKPSALNILKDLDLNIKFVKEMGVWSQAWYLPTRDDPSDGVFEHYENMRGIEYESTQETSNEGIDNEVETVHSVIRSDDNIDGNDIPRSGIHSEVDGNDRDNNTVDGNNTVKSMIEVMKGYLPGTHHAIRDYSYGMMNDGVAPETIIQTIKGLMYDKREGSKRNAERYNDIERIVKGARDDNTSDGNLFNGSSDGPIFSTEGGDRIFDENRLPGRGTRRKRKVNKYMDKGDTGAGKKGRGHRNGDKSGDRNGDKNLLREGEKGGKEDIRKRAFSAVDRKKAKQEKMILPWPPGLMGDLAKSVYKFSPYPNRVISIVTALGLLAGIGGRRFNVSGNGLNLYITLLMDTGGGKSVISKFINRVLSDCNLLTGANSFTGSGRYTGPKALMDDLYDKRCIISVFTEAGFMFRSKAGDQDGLTRSILDLYGSSGYGCVSSGGAYSSEKNNIKAVMSPCFSMINESTPDIFLETLKNGDKTGEVNRMNIMRVEQETFRLNREMEYKLSEDVHDKIKRLMGRCMKTQSNDDADVTNLIVTDRMYEFADEMKEEGWKYKEDDYVRFSMLQRSAEKVFKVAGLLTIMNTSACKGEREMPIGDIELDWALKFHEFEMYGLTDFFDLSDDLEPFEISCIHVFPVVKKILSCGYKDIQMQPDKFLRDKNKFPLCMLRRALKNCSAIKNIGSNNISGMDRMIKWLKDNGYFSDAKSVKKNVVLVNKSFLELGE